MILSVYVGKEINGAVLSDLVMLLGSDAEEGKRLHTLQYYAWKLLNDFGNSLVILAHAEDKLRPIGCITFTAKPSSIDSLSCLFELGDVMVSHEARGAMLFVKMLRIGVDRLKSEGKFLVYGTPNDEAWPHEKRVGFRLVDNNLKYYGMPFPLISIELLSRIATFFFRFSRNIFFRNSSRENFFKPGFFRASVLKKISFAGSIIDILAQIIFYPIWLSFLLPFYIFGKISSNISIVNLEKFDDLGCPSFLNRSFLLKNTAYLNWRYVDSPDVYIKRTLINKNGIVAIYVFKEFKFRQRTILYLVDAIYFQNTVHSKIGLLYVIFTLPIYKYFSFVTMLSDDSKMRSALLNLLLSLRPIKFIVFSSVEVDVPSYGEFYAGDGDNI